jgi:hypothetical protein
MVDSMGIFLISTGMVCEVLSFSFLPDQVSYTKAFTGMISAESPNHLLTLLDLR